MKSAGISEDEKLLFAPGCALMLYKPELAEKIHKLINENLGGTDILMTCCQHDPVIKARSLIINVCPGCDKRFRNDFGETSTISLWEILDRANFFTFPDYNGQYMSIIDACPTRDQDKIHNAIRSLLLKMNIKLVEPENTRTNSTCCGDIYYGEIPKDEVIGIMKKRASEMPARDVVVHCVFCIKSVFIGGKNPKYLLDLLFAEQTDTKKYDLDEWHKLLSAYKEEH